MKNKFLIVLVTCTSILYGQKFPRSLSVPADTLCFSKLPEAEKVKELSLFKAEVVDTLHGPTAYILRKKIKEVYYYYLAIGRGEQFLIYTLFKGCEPISSYYLQADLVLGNKPNGLSITRCQLNKEGNPELIIGFSTSESSGAGPGGGSGYSRKSTGYQILDLDNLQCITLFVSERYETWPYGGGLVATNTGMVHYTDFKVDFENNTFNIEGEGIKKRKYIYNGTCFVKLNLLGIAQSGNNKPIDSLALSGFENLLNTLLKEKGDSTIVCNTPSQKYRILFYCNGGYGQHRRLYSGKSYEFSSIKRDDRSVTLSFGNTSDSLKDSEFWFVVSDSGKFEKVTTDKYPSRFFVDSDAADITRDHNIKKIDLSDNTPPSPNNFGDTGEIRISSYRNSKYIVIDRIFILESGNETDNGLIYSYYLEKFE